MGNKSHKKKNLSEGKEMPPQEVKTVLEQQAPNVPTEQKKILSEQKPKEDEPKRDELKVEAINPPVAIEPVQPVQSEQPVLPEEHNVPK